MRVGIHRKLKVINLSNQCTGRRSEPETEESSFRVIRVHREVLLRVSHPDYRSSSCSLAMNRHVAELLHCLATTILIDDHLVHESDSTRNSITEPSQNLSIMAHGKAPCFCGVR